MQRIDRQRLDSAIFPVMVTVPTRYDDLDTQGHVNNAAGIVILQEARARLDQAAGLAQWRAGGLRIVLAAISVEYAAELHYPEPVDVYSGIISMGRTSFVVAQLAKQNGRSAIYAEAVTVIANADGPMPLPDELRAAYQRLCFP